ncbi:MAG TPA: NAD(P)/FAD-dependent oxidoreductase [Anaerolineae bacterium]|nr:NAD(P)/FAD-dependent oxidoreductase [Anaerolineae bacterium]
MRAQEKEGRHVVIVGGGFAGLYAARSLARAGVQVTLLDKRNFHLFQPLLYQVATGNVPPGDISSPLRSVLSRYKNVRVLLGEWVDLLPEEHKVILADGELSYDTLIVATGVQPTFFGQEAWTQWVTPLKTIEDATVMRRQILYAFEAAERETDPDLRRAWMTFVVIGGGSAGVELSGAIGELAHSTLRSDFRSIEPQDARILLLELADRILPTFPPSLSAKAEASLARLGVIVQTGTRVTDVREGIIQVRRGEQIEQIETRTILWTAGVRATPVAQTLSQRTGAMQDRMGRIVVEPDLTVRGYPDILVLGDLAHLSPTGGEPLPAVAPVAIQEGQYAAKLVRARLEGRSIEPFSYFDRGNLAVIGRNAAVAEIGRLRFGGLVAWLLWVFVHIVYLIGFENRMLVLFRWAWNYWTRKRGARLIVGME